MHACVTDIMTCHRCLLLDQPTLMTLPGKVLIHALTRALNEPAHDGDGYIADQADKLLACTLLRLAVRDERERYERGLRA